MLENPALRALRALILLSMGAGCLGDSPGDKTDDSDSTSPVACEGSTPITDSSGVATGFERCADGTIHRASAVGTDKTISAESCRGDETYQSCSTDADCTARPNGKCIHDDYVELGGKSRDTGGNQEGCNCAYSCASDADCNAGEACVPPGLVSDEVSWAQCVPAECKTDADCTSAECALTTYDDGCSYQTYLTCREATDACRTDADCTDGKPCAADYVGTIECQSIDCAIGRPLLVDGRGRTAAPAAREDWAAELDAAAPADEALAAELAAHWLRVGALEHASVASFARFTLQLLALGAPPELLMETQRAAADEIQHARLTYGLAAAYGAHSGPGPLPLADLDLETERRAVIRGLIEEACVGETLGAAEAAAAADCAEDASVAAVLRRIADDEARHAALAWKSLRWLVGEDSELHAFAAEVFATAIEAARRAPGPALSAPAHGVLGPASRHAIHLAALREVVAPCVSALAGSAREALA